MLGRELGRREARAFGVAAQRERHRARAAERLVPPEDSGRRDVGVAGEDLFPRDAVGHRAVALQVRELDLEAHLVARAHDVRDRVEAVEPGRRVDQHVVRRAGLRVERRVVGDDGPRLDDALRVEHVAPLRAVGGVEHVELVVLHFEGDDARAQRVHRRVLGRVPLREVRREEPALRQLRLVDGDVEVVSAHGAGRPAVGGERLRGARHAHEGLVAERVTHRRFALTTTRQRNRAHDDRSASKTREHVRLPFECPAMWVAVSDGGTRQPGMLCKTL